MASAPSVRLAVPAGTAVIYDARLHHRGASNTHPNRVRPSFYFSFIQEAGDKPDGPTYSIRGTYAKARLTLDELVLGGQKVIPSLPKGEGPSEQNCHAWANKHCGKDWLKTDDAAQACHELYEESKLLRALTDEELDNLEATRKGWFKHSSRAQMHEAHSACYNAHIQKIFGWGIYEKIRLLETRTHHGVHSWNQCSRA